MASRNPSPGVRASTRVGAKTRASARPLPRSLIEVYYWSESAFRDRVHELEADPRFEKLMGRGVLEKVRLRGKIPRHKYEDFKDQELTAFFEKYGISKNPGWESDFFDPKAMARRHALAKKYGCPVGELSRILRYCSYLYDLTDGGPSRAVNTDSEAPDFLHFTPSDDLFDMSPILTKVEAFTRRYSLEREQFAHLFFSGERDIEDVTAQVGCSRREAEVIREMVDRVQTISSLQMDIGPSRIADTRASTQKGANKAQPVAEIFLDALGQPQLRLLADDLYDVKYRFHKDEDSKLSREEQDLVQELKAVNQRKTVLVRLVTYLYKFQYRFFATGKQTDLLPLTQARVARELQEEEATVSRLIRDKTLRTPWGTYPIKWGFVRTGKVVEILLTEREAAELEAGTRVKPYTDKEIQAILRKEYGVDLSRRSITYHRNKYQKASNYYARRRASTP